MRLNAPILFLDFDGVLYPDRVYRVQGQIVLKCDGLGLFEWAPILDELLAPHPAIGIVLSTSWVSVLGFDTARDWLPPSLRERVVGATWSMKVRNEWKRCSRFEQIRRAVLRHEIGRWIAIDDDVLHWPESHRAHLVATDPDLGLGCRKAQERLRDRLVWLVDHED